MELVDYLHVYELQNTGFAKAIGYSRAAIQHYLSHKMKCSDKFAIAVEMHTKGVVTAKEMKAWNAEGMERLGEYGITEKQKKFIACEINPHLCKDCKKKLTKVGLMPKKEAKQKKA